MSTCELNETVANSRENLFFISHLDLQKYNRIIDFGCGCGRTIEELFKNKINEKIEIIGADSSKAKLETAIGRTPNCSFCHPAQALEMIDNKTIVILNFVIHRIFGSTSRDEQFQIFNRIAKAGAIVVHDLLAPSYSYQPRFDDLQALRQICCSNEFIENYVEYQEVMTLYSDKETQFDKDFQFCVKMLRSNNWDREKIEDYYCGDWGMIRDIFNFDRENLVISFSKNYTNEKSKKLFKEKFGYDIPFTTHRQIIFEKESNL